MPSNPCATSCSASARTESRTTRPVVVVEELARGGRVPLSLRLPVALLPSRVDVRPVSLIDVAPSLFELFGVRAPDPTGPPFLLDSDFRGPHFVLATRPLAGAFADADDVWLYTKGVAYVNAPSRGRATEIDAITRDDSPAQAVDHDAALVAELRTVLTRGFGYRFEEVARIDLEQVIGGDATPMADQSGAPARVTIARH